MATSMDSISCSICLDPLKDPDNQKGVYSCPQCRQTFIPRPTGLQAAPLAHCYAGPGDTHLQPHYESPTFKKHKLVKASTQLQDKICSRHDKLLEMYCRTDQQMICYLCVIGDHKDSFANDLWNDNGRFVSLQRQQGEKQRIQKIEKEMHEVRRSVKSLKAAVEESEKIFTELICTFERRCSEVKELIKAQEKAAVSQAEGRLKQLEQEIAKLRRRDAEMERLSHKEDHIHFLQVTSLVSLSTAAGVTAESDRSSLHIFQPVEPRCLTTFSTPQSEWLVGELASCRNDATFQKTRPEPKTREEFLEYSCQLTLDPNTANNWLCLSEGNRKVTWSPWSNKAQPYPDHPDRFSSYEQVLCREGLSGTCYWEVEWSAFKAYIAISYKGIGRIGRGDACWFGGNDQSWSLVCCSIFGCYFYHNNKRTAIHVPRSSRIIGVYLDHRAGTLSFYSFSDTMTLLHRVQTTFNQPLYPGFWIYAGSSVKILNQ
uniref:B30.2/SPRY domain-containing protein n=1 Tax=Hucho hucho TaxID=62062 RepID=A0A4W5M1Q2_9TELE